MLNFKKNIKKLSELQELATDKIDVVNAVNNKISLIESEIISALQTGEKEIEILTSSANDTTQLPSQLEQHDVEKILTR